MSRARPGDPEEPQPGSPDQPAAAPDDPGGRARDELANRPDEPAGDLERALRERDLVERGHEAVERGEWDVVKEVIAELEPNRDLQEFMRVRATEGAGWLGDTEAAREFHSTIRNDVLREMFMPPEPDPPA